MRTLEKLLVALGLAAIATSAFAANQSVKEAEKAIKGTGKYGTAGCGLGSLAFDSQPGAVQILAVTLNATGVQTFGITTGTSNCQPGLFAQGTKDFVDANREVLAKDAARGEGEAIFPSEKATNEEVTDAILRTLRSDPALGCGQG